MFYVLTNRTIVDPIELGSFPDLVVATNYAEKVAPLLKTFIPDTDDISQCIIVSDDDGEAHLIIDLKDLVHA
jgi:hypothetical protein